MELYGLPSIEKCVEQATSLILYLMLHLLHVIIWIAIQALKSSFI